MRRAVIAVVVALPLTLGTAVASAHGDRGGWGGGPFSPQASVAGTVVSTNPTAGTFTANAYVLTPPAFTGFPGASFGRPGFGGPGWGRGPRLAPRWISPTTTPTTPATTLVTITVGPNTKILVDGRPSTVAGLAANDKFIALFSGSASDSIQTLTASPALAVFAHVPPTPKQLYAFVGTVSSVSGTGNTGTVTVTVADSYPSGFFSGSATFTVGPSTLILGGSSTTGNGLFGGSLSDVTSGDTVAGAIVAPAGDTAAQVEALPLAALLDFPASSATTTSAAKASALNSTLALFGVKHSTKAKAKKKHHHRKHHKKK